MGEYNNFKVFQLEDCNEQGRKKYLVKNNHFVMRGSSILQLVHCVSYQNFSGQHCSLCNLDIILHTGQTISFLLDRLACILIITWFATLQKYGTGYLYFVISCHGDCLYLI